MTIKYMRSKGLMVIIALCVVSITSVVSAQGVPISVPGLEGNVKANIQADIMTSSTSVNVKGGASGDVRVMKQNQSGTSTINVNKKSDVMVDTSTSTSTTTDADVIAEVKSDKNVSKVESDDTSVSVWYKVPAKLFGFIPLGMTVRTTVGSAGEVKVTHPWYSVLTSSDDENSEQSIQAKIDAAIESSNLSVESGTTLSGKAKVTLIRSIHGILKQTVR